MDSLLFYQNPVPLDPHVHRDLRLAPGWNDYQFAAKTNSVPLAGLEFIEAAKEYTIVFTRTHGGPIVPAALLGLREGENLFVEGAGGWGGALHPCVCPALPLRARSRWPRTRTASLH